MATQQRPKHQVAAKRLVKEAAVAIKKGQIKKKAFTQTKAEEKARPKSKETLADAKKALRAAQAKVKQERQARAKAEKALAEAQEALAAARLKAEHRAQIRRVSFVVRLTVDEYGQIGRTEIEHVESSSKQNFLSLDGARLVAFMKACISPIDNSEPAIPPVRSTEKVRVTIAGPRRPKSNLIVSEAQVFRLGDPDFMTLILAREEPFGFKAGFQLQGSDAHFLTTYASPFEIKLYAIELTSGESRLLTTYRAKLIQDVLEYTASVEAPGLRPGLYRLFTVVILSAPIKMAGFYSKTIINVT